jgi:protein kinase-like protein
MHDHVTLLRPEPREADPRGMSSALPADFVEQIRLRVRVLAVLILIPFAFDPLLFAGNWLVASLRGVPLPREVASTAPFQWVNLAAVTASAALWAIARSRRVSASRLLVAGVVYEIAICFVIATISIWQHFLDRGYVPTLTWVPGIVILFPLVLPGPPRRVLWGSIAAGAMAPLALFLLDVFDTVAPRPEAYAQTIISSVFAVGFAYMGARVVYGLGREVVAARALGSYQLEERLGQGGMGEVWRARHRLLARPAAIKVIKPSLIADARTAASADVFRRFEREAQITARLRSPHTVELFDFGVADDGAFYYVMELLDGLDVDRLVRASGRSVVRPRPPRHQAGKHLPLPLRRGLRFRQGAGLRHRESRVPRSGGSRHRSSSDPRQRRSRHAGVHRARAGDGCGARRTRRYLRDRLRGVLAAHGRARLHRRHADRYPDTACDGASHGAIGEDRAPDPRGAR